MGRHGYMKSEGEEKTQSSGKEEDKPSQGGRAATTPEGDTPASKQQESGSAELRAGGAEEASLLDQVEQLKSALAERSREASANYDRFLRERAELENFKRRMQREKMDALKYSAEALVRDLLPVIDNLERAIAHAEQGGDGQPVVEGLSLVLKSFLDTLERHGVKQVKPKGKPFDPALHEALAHVESKTEKPNTVIEEYHKGYMLHDRLLRPAAVAVAKAPEKPTVKGDSGGGPVENPDSDG